MSRSVTMCDYAHAARVCSKLETELRGTISRTQHAIKDAQAELQNMLDIINEGRADRGLPPLDEQLTPARRIA